MEKIKISVSDLTDEEVLKEFVNRFECDGAVLIYLDSKTEFGFGRWQNPTGRKWVNNLFKTIKKDTHVHINSNEYESGTVVPLSS